MDTASPQPGHLVLPLTAAEVSGESPKSIPLKARQMARPEWLPTHLAHDLWLASEAAVYDVTVEEFGEVLARAAQRYNSGLPPQTVPTSEQSASFVQKLRLADLALAAACALGREAAWQRFFDLYRAPLTQAAIAITGSATLGHDLADSLYAELYGLRSTGNDAAETRLSPLSSYSGRGSLIGWLRTTLAQRHVDYHRHTRRETPLGTLDAPAPEQASSPMIAELGLMSKAVGQTLLTLEAEDRFLLSAYFLDRQTLLQIARTLHVHEATISRRIKRLTADLRKHLLRELEAKGLSRRAAEEALGTDPRDIEINLRSLLQTSHGPPFSSQTQQSPSSSKTPTDTADPA